MAAGVSPATTAHRPPAVWTTVAVLVFLGTTAFAGGMALVGGSAAPPGQWLDRIPVIDSWVVPGLVLAAGFGCGALLTTYGILRRPDWAWARPVERLTRHHWSWIATLLLGLGHLAWIGAELVYLP